MKTNKVVLILATLLFFISNIYGQGADDAQDVHQPSSIKQAPQNDGSQGNTGETESTAGKSGNAGAPVQTRNQTNNYVQQQRNSAKRKIDTMVKDNEYAESRLVMINHLKSEAIKSIEDAQSEDIDGIINRFKAGIEEIPSNTKIESFESAINNHLRVGVKSDDYTVYKLNEIQSLREEFKNNIDSWQSVQKIEEEINRVINEIDKIPTAKEQVDELIQQHLNDRISTIEKDIAEKTPFEFLKEQAIALVGVLLALAIVALLIIHIRKVKKNLGDNKSDIDANQVVIKEIQEWIKNTDERINEQKSKYRSLENKISDNENSSKRNFDNLSKNIELQKTALSSEKIAPELIPDDPVDDFNNWACNPLKILPSRFYYLKGDIKVRNEQIFVESEAESKWITNRLGAQKYLFPNPRFFYEATDIRELYKITGTLKAKGQNNIRISEPCKILDKGYINYAGKLTLL
ncbi:MAG: hypothetical protein LBT01_03370 [Spirochaetaceae bacterium]|jgi:hypothetical protein|nr:hypothetical protein [Spirochaetaceae bacterium]